MPPPRRTARSAPEYIHAEWLCDVVVGSGLQPLQFIAAHSLRSKEYEGYMRRVDIRLEATAEFKAVHPGHHHVAYDDVYIVRLQQAEGLPPVGGCQNSVLLRQCLRHIVEQIQVVIPPMRTAG